MNSVAKIIDDRTIHIFDKSQFDWYQIRNSGQIFRDPPCEITEEVDKITITATGGKDSGYLWNFFDLDTDYNEIKRELLRFKVLHEPIKAGHGIRILRQLFNETVISFIISANNNIKRFTKTVEQIDFNKLEQYTENDFKTMGCGYRAPYLLKTICRLKEIDYCNLNKLGNDELRRKLTELSGVGPKVADCVLLFAFHRLAVAPVDTHIRRATEQLGLEQANAVFSHKYAGVAQQYIFYYLQHLKKELK